MMNEVQGVDGLSNEPILVPVGDTTYKAARLSMDLMARVGSRWREERINSTLAMARVMRMAPSAHIEFLSHMAIKRFTVYDILTDFDLQRLCVQVACEIPDPKFNAGALGQETCAAVCMEILYESELLQRPQPGTDGKANPTETKSQSTGEQSSVQSAPVAT